VLVVLSVAVLGGVAGALECNPGICQGNPCTIAGSHQLEPGCTLDFTGKDVTLAPNALLVFHTSYGDAGELLSGNLTVRGGIDAPEGGFLSVFADGNFDMERPAKITAAGHPSQYCSVACDAEVDIFANGSVTLDGSIISVTASDPTVRIEGADVTTSTRINLVSPAALGGEDAILELTADEGAITVTKKPITIKASGQISVFPQLEVNAFGDISIGVPILFKSTNILGNGEIDISSASGTVTLAKPVRMRGTGIGGVLNVVAGKDLLVAGSIDAHDGGVLYPRSGDLFLTALGSVVVTAPTIDLTSRRPGPPITIGEGLNIRGCSVTLSSRVRASGAGAVSNISYLQSLDLTGASISGDRFSTNTIVCPCTDANNDNMCDAGCTSPPIGLNPASFKPPFVFTPNFDGPCS